MDEREEQKARGAHEIARRTVVTAMAKFGYRPPQAAAAAPTATPTTTPPPAAAVEPHPAASWKATIDRLNGKKTEAKAGLWSKVVAALNERIRNGE